MSTTFSVVYDASSTPYESQLPLLTSNVLAAAERWGEYFTGFGSIEIEVEFSDLNGSGRAGGTSLSSTPVGTAGAITVLQFGMAHEIDTGIDVNGSTPDVLINIAPGYFLNELWLDPTPLDRSTPGPAGRTDAVSVFLHELGHALAFNGWRNWATAQLPLGGTYESVFDSFVTTVSGVSYFNGPNAMAVYGGPVPLTVNNLFHFGNNAPQPGSSLIPDLMNGIVFYRGTIYDISRLDIAVMEDIGLPVNLSVGFVGDDSFVGGAGNDSITGDSRNNVLRGLDGADTLNGGAGNDTLEGGSGDDWLEGGPGNDTFVVDSTLDVVVDSVEGAAGGIDLVRTAVDFSLAGSQVEHASVSGATGRALTGSTLANVLTGGGGADTLVGGGGKDTLVGALGDDRYVVNLVLAGSALVLEDLVTEVAAAGTDTLELQISGSIVLTASVTLTLAATLENLVLTGTQNLNATGNALANTLTGNEGDNLLKGLSSADTLLGNLGDDTLDGGASQDSLAGGAGNDSYVLDSATDLVDEGVGEGTSDTVRILYSTPTAATHTTLTVGVSFANVENIAVLGSGIFHLTGDSANNRLAGNASSTSLTGAAGDDTLDGGAGNDTLFGGLANDSLVGGLGSDSLVGGDGNDTYSVDSAGDVIVELDSEGTDAVLATVNYSLLGRDFVESLTLTGSATSGTGSAGANTLTGSSLNNSLDGGAGADTLLGLAGNDTLNGGLATDSMDGGAGNDTYVIDDAGDIAAESGIGSAGGTDLVNASASHTLGANIENLSLTGLSSIDGAGNVLPNRISGNGGANRLEGGGGNDTLAGGAGDDILAGGAGNDSLTGGTGTDSFLFDTPLGADNVDRISDFTFGQDILVLDAGVFAQLGLADTFLSAGQFRKGAGIIAAGDADDRIVLNTTSGDIFYDVDGIGGAAAVRFATLSGAGVANLTANDIFVSDQVVPIGQTFVLGTPGAILLAPVPLNVGGASDMISGDFNGDGRTDLVASFGIYPLVTTEVPLQLLLGNGTGGFSNATATRLLGGPTSNSGRQFASGDFNGDGAPDVFLADTGYDAPPFPGHTNTLLLSDGAGNLVNSPSNIPSTLAFTHSVAVADIDGANGLDIYVGDISGNAPYFLINDGEGSFTRANELVPLAYRNPSAGTAYTTSALVDVDADDDADLVLGGIDVAPSVILFNDGTGHFADPLELPAEPFDDNSITLDIDAVDINRDGRMDLLLTQTDGDPFYSGRYLQILVQDELGGFVDETAARLPQSPANSLSWQMWTDLFDMDGDGDQDIVAQYTFGVGGVGQTLQVFLNDGSGRFSSTGDALGRLSYEIADFNGDLLPDVVATYGGGPGRVTFQFVPNIAGNGSDSIAGTALPDRLIGASGNDTMVGGAGNDTLFGGAGGDLLDGGAGADTMDGGPGNDIYIADDPGDVASESIAGAAGGVDLANSSVTITLGVNVEHLALTGSGNLDGTGSVLANVIAGNSGDNSLSGAGGNDSLLGNAGNDSLDGGSGQDTMIGGLGNDLYVVDIAGETVTEALNAGTDSVRSSVSYTLGANLENLELAAGAGNLNGTGNTLANTLTGNEGNNRLNGLTGNDTLSGGAGSDTLDGGAGNDLMTGGSGADRFLFALAPSAATNVNSISDFESGVDRIAVDKDIFTGLPIGALNAAAFVAGPGLVAAPDASVRFVYNSSTGNLYYDASGNTGAAPVLVVTLTGAPTLTATDFEVLV